MKSFKKMLKLLSLGMIILLACLGIAMAGGVPIPNNKRREGILEIKTELVEFKEDLLEIGVLKDVKE